MNDIENKIDDLFFELKNSKLYRDYLKVKKQLEDNKEIMTIIDEIKKLQKIATNNKVEVIELKLKELYSNLNSYPVYQNYIIIKEELNDNLYIIKDIFEKYFKDLLKI